MATLIKHSERTIRKPCSKCKSTDLYWAHDPNGPISTWKFGRKIGQPKTCLECPGKPANWTLINRDGTRHDCQGDGKQDGPEDDSAVDESAAIVDSPPAPTFTPAVTPPAPTPAATSDAFSAALGPFAAALAPVLAPLIGSKVDESQVRGIVKDMIAGINPPLHVTYETADGTVKQVKGASHKTFPRVLNKILAGRKAGWPVHVYMHGPAGTGKTSIAPQVAEVLGLPYYPISLGPTMTEVKLMGYMNAAGKHIGTQWTQAIEFGGLVLLDECDSANPMVLTVADAALANGHVGFPDGRTVEIHKDFTVVAAGNTTMNGATGAYVRQKQDKAFVDRFSMVYVDYDEALEESQCMSVGLDSATVTKVLGYVRAIRANMLRDNMEHVCGMRASIGACVELAGGESWDDVIESRIRHGISDTDWRKATSGVHKPVI
jgi:cobaltochelatase CobS